MVRLWLWPRQASGSLGLPSIPAQLRGQAGYLASCTGLLCHLTEEASLQAGFLGMVPECQMWGNHSEYTIHPVDFGGLLDHPVEEAKKRYCVEMLHGVRRNSWCFLLFKTICSIIKVNVKQDHTRIHSQLFPL